MRAFALLLLVTLLGAGTAPAAPDPLAVEQRQTFVVQIETGHGRALIASGVVVARDAGTLTIATVSAVLRLHRPPIVMDQSREAYYHVLDGHLSEKAGVAYILVQAQPAFSVDAPHVAPPYSGEPVWIWGHPDGFWVMSTGTIGTIDGATAEIDCATCAPGDGGAGVFDGFGRLVGVINGPRSMSVSSVVSQELPFDRLATRP